jgi:hypothetical protein
MKLDKYLKEFKYLNESGENKTGLPDKFTVVGNLKNTSSGKAIKGNTYTITAGDKQALMAKNQDKDWFIVTTPILKVALKDGTVEAA